MKTIKIFLASSEELSPEREKMADLVLHLNKLFKGRGIELDLEKWEYLVAATAKLYNNIGIVYYDLHLGESPSKRAS